MIGIGVIGYGYWGPNLVRNFNGLEEARVTAVCDQSPKRCAAVQNLYPSVATYADAKELIADPKVNAVIVATPVSTHFRLAMQALEAGKHVLVEKPLALNGEQAAILVEEAERRNLVLMVDHTFVYHGAVQRIRDLVQAGQLGRLHYFDSTRVNLGLF